MSIIYRIIFVTWIAYSVSTVYSCDNHSLRQALSHLDCTTFSYPSACAKAARKIATERESGAWGAVVVSNTNFLVNQSVSWQFHKVKPYPSKCRVTAHNWVIEVFRTGWREQNLENNQINEIADLVVQANMDLSAVDLCPISFLRGLVEIIPIVNIRSDLAFLQKKASKNLGGYWNIFLLQSDIGTNLSTNVGFDFPHYFFNSRSGFCIKSISNKYKIIIFKIGYKSEKEERLQLGF